MNKINYIITILLLGFSVACISTVKSNKATLSDYSEDLTAYLPPITIDTVIEVSEAPITIDSTLNITARLDSTLQLVNEYNTHKTRYIEGLSIQLYSGNDRSKAKEVQLRVYRYFPESKPKIIFDQPNYKVRMEQFYTQLEAYPVYKSVQAKFGRAILVPIRIPVSRK